MAPGVVRSRLATIGSRRASRSSDVNTETDAPIWLVGAGVAVAVTITFSAMGATASWSRTPLTEHSAVAVSNPESAASTRQLLAAPASKRPFSSAKVDAISWPEASRTRMCARGIGWPAESTTMPVTASAAWTDGMAASETSRTNSDVREWLTRAPFGVSRAEQRTAPGPCFLTCGSMQTPVSSQA